MTEAEWLACADPEPMRKFLENQRRLKQSWRRPSLGRAWLSGFLAQPPPSDPIRSRVLSVGPLQRPVRPGGARRSGAVC